MTDIDTIRERHREHRGGCAWCGKWAGERDGWPCDTRVVLDALDFCAADRLVAAKAHGQYADHAKALAEALRQIIRDHSLPRPIDWYPANTALAAYDKDHEPHRPPWVQPPTTIPKDHERWRKVHESKGAQQERERLRAKARLDDPMAWYMSDMRPYLEMLLADPDEDDR